eukprot:scaffold139259_cov17-Prasinocladus_malaysianus.AAC.1
MSAALWPCSDWQMRIVSREDGGLSHADEDVPYARNQTASSSGHLLEDSAKSAVNFHDEARHPPCRLFQTTAHAPWYVRRVVFARRIGADDYEYDRTFRFERIVTNCWEATAQTHRRDG